MNEFLSGQDLGVNQRVCDLFEGIGFGVKDEITREDMQQLVQSLQGIAQEVGQQVPGPVFNARTYGLTRERIEKFEHFSADESLAGEECIVCLEDLEVGTEMVRLDCHVSHYLCETCTHAWFKEHKKCPTCNHVFQQNID